MSCCFYEDFVNDLRGVASGQEVLAEIRCYLYVVRCGCVLFPVALEVAEDEAF